MKSSVKKYDSKRKLQEGEKAGQQKRKKEEISGMKRGKPHEYKNRPEVWTAQNREEKVEEKAEECEKAQNMSKYGQGKRGAESIRG